MAHARHDRAHLPALSRTICPHPIESTHVACGHTCPMDDATTNHSASQAALVKRMTAWVSRVPGRSIPKLAEASGLDPSYLRKVIAFKTSISLPNLESVAGAMGMTSAEAISHAAHDDGATVGFALRCLSERLIDKNETVKITVASLLSRLAQYPDKAGEVAETLQNLLGAEESEPRLTSVQQERREAWDSGSLTRTVEIDNLPPQSRRSLSVSRSRKGGKA